MRLGIFGGSFDPVHYGHLLLAECCREQCRLDEVWFLPADLAPHKQAAAPSSGKQRVEMLELAIGGHPQLRVCDLELRRGGVSYTVTTLEELHREQPAAELFFLLGADSLRDLPQWREPARICELAWPVVVARPEAPPPNFAALAPLVSAERLAAIERLVVHMPLMGLSSSEIRRRVAAGESIRFQTPRAVEQYIETQGLYRVSNG